MPRPRNCSAIIATASRTSPQSTAPDWPPTAPTRALRPTNVQIVVMQNHPVALGGNGFDTVNGVSIDLFCDCPGGKIATIFLNPGNPGLHATALTFTLPDEHRGEPAYWGLGLSLIMGMTSVFRNATIAAWSEFGNASNCASELVASPPWATIATKIVSRSPRCPKGAEFPTSHSFALRNWSAATAPYYRRAGGEKSVRCSSAACSRRRLHDA